MGFRNWFRTNWDNLSTKVMIWLSQRDGEDGLTSEDFKIAVDLIRKAEEEFPTGAEKRSWVLENLATLRDIALPHLLELLFWTALNYASKKGWISLGESSEE